MRFALSPEQRQFAAALHDLLAAADVPAAARAWSAGDVGPGLALWRKLADTGVTGLAVPEKWGGLGAEPIDLVVAFEELGHHAVPGPWVESATAVPVLLAGVGDEELCGRWLPGLADGSERAALSAGPWLPRARDIAAATVHFSTAGSAAAAGGSAVAGESVRVIALPSASSLAGSAADLPQPIGSAPTAEVTPVEATSPGAAVAAGLDAGALACAAQLLGAGRALLERGVEYVQQRVQFGRPVGQFQAVQHQLADVLIGLEFARPLLYAAALADPATRARDVSAAKVACGEAAHRAARVALQVHGAIGFTREYDLSLWLDTVRVLRRSWGTAAEHRARVLEAL